MKIREILFARNSEAPPVSPRFRTLVTYCNFHVESFVTPSGNGNNPAFFAPISYTRVVCEELTKFRITREPSSRSRNSKTLFVRAWLINKWGTKRKNKNKKKKEKREKTKQFFRPKHFLVCDIMRAILVLREMEGSVCMERTRWLCFFSFPLTRKKTIVWSTEVEGKRSFRHFSPRGEDDRSRLAISSGGISERSDDNLSENRVLSRKNGWRWTN